MNHTIDGILGALAVTVGVALGSFGGGLSAQDNFSLGMTLDAPAPTCTVTIEDADLGQVEAGSSNVSVFDTFDMIFNCTGAIASATATFDGGNNPGAPLIRRMSGPGGLIDYGLQQLPGSLIEIDGVIVLALSSGVTNETLGVYTSVAATYPSVDGVYSDQVMVTFTF